MGPDKELIKFLEGVVGVVGAVEASSYEKMCLYRDHSDTLVQQFAGIGRTIGEFCGMPVFLSLTTAEIRGHKILFYEPTSQVVNHLMVRAWLAENLPETAMESVGKYRLVDAMNFENAFPRRVLKNLDECSPVEQALWELVLATRAVINASGLPATPVARNLLDAIDKAMPFITREA